MFPLEIAISKHYFMTGICQVKTYPTRFSPGGKLSVTHTAWQTGFRQGKAWTPAFHQARRLAPLANARGKPGEDLFSRLSPGEMQFPVFLVSVGLPSEHQVLTMGKPGVYQVNTRFSVE